MGENYVLGNRDDCNEFKPYKLDPRMFENRDVLMMACGTMHCVTLTNFDDQTPVPVLDQSLLPAAEEVEEPKIKERIEIPDLKPKAAIVSPQSKKRPIEEITGGAATSSQHAHGESQLENGSKQLKVEENRESEEEQAEHLSS